MTGLLPELLPCPFCSGAPEVERIGSARASMIVACTDCGARMESGDVGGLTNPDQWAWNRRALREAAVPSEEPVAWVLDPRLLARIRELSTPPGDDHDRAVLLLLDAYETQETAHQDFRLQNDREWRAKLDHLKDRLREVTAVPFRRDQRAQAAILADLPDSVAQEAGSFYEAWGAVNKDCPKRDCMADAWRHVIRPYLIGLRDHYPPQSRPAPENTHEN